MKKEKELLDKLQEHCAAPIQAFPAVVSSVDTDNYTIDVIYDGSVELFNVRLKAAINSNKECVVMVPKVDSDVLVGLIGNNDKALYMVQATKLTSLTGKIGETTFEITTDGVVINGGENDGVFVSQSLLDEINAIKSDIRTLKEVFLTNWIVVAQDGGAALKTAAASWAGTELADTELSSVINDKLKH